MDRRPALFGLITYALLALTGTSLACGDATPVGGSSSAEPDLRATDDREVGATPDPDAAADTLDAVTDSVVEAVAEVAAPDALETAAVDDSPLGTDRPAKLVLPDGYSAGTPYPLLILLHGFSASGVLQDLYLGLSPAAARRGFVTIIPEGTKNATGQQFWNASPGWCCDFGNSGVDDAGYLLSLVDLASARVNIDPDRVYLVGHSNGGFMAYKMACEHADRFAAIVSIAGSMPLQAADCNPSEPVAVLEIHGTLDLVVSYLGGIQRYPGAEEVVARWAGYDGCELLPKAQAALDYDQAVLGDETHPQTFPGCSAGSVMLWELRGSSHVPAFNAAFVPAVLDWLSAQR